MGQSRGWWAWCIVALIISHPALADLKKSNLQAKAPSTQGGALLHQVDILSIYFSSEKIAHAPRLVDGKRIEVESTILDRALSSDREAIHQFVSRQIAVFLEELQKRLAVYAPEVAKHFQPNSDIRFVILNGPEKQPLGVWEEGEWKWLTAQSAVSATSVKKQETQVAVPSTTKRKWDDCPALKKNH